jgi:hypothetical protein
MEYSDIPNPFGTEGVFILNRKKNLYHFELFALMFFFYKQ